MKRWMVWLVVPVVCAGLALCARGQSVAGVARQKQGGDRKVSPARVITNEELKTAKRSTGQARGKSGKTRPAGAARRRTAARGRREGRDNLAWANDMTREARSGREKLAAAGRESGRRIRAENKRGRDALVQEAKDERREELYREIPFGQTTNSFQKQLDEWAAEKSRRSAQRPGRGSGRKR